MTRRMIKVEVIIRNAAQCLKCNDIVESVHRHDFRWCKCGAIAVDGGKEYRRRVGDLDAYKDVSEYYMEERESSLDY